MSEKKRFGILEVIKSRPYVVVTASQIAECYMFLAEVAEAVEKLQAFNQRLEAALTEITDKIDLVADGAVLQGNRIARLEERIDALQGAGRSKDE
ncbi:MAG: hypothetical protein ABIH46_11300 [Chloroflexota bacterium]